MDKNMTKEELIAGIQGKLTEALSFVVESTPNIKMDEPIPGRKSADTEYFNVSGEYAVGELFGKIELVISVSPHGARPVNMKMSFGDELPTPVSISSPSDLFESIKTKHKLFVERSYSKSSAFALNDALRELENLQCAPETHAKIMEILAKIR